MDDTLDDHFELGMHSLNHWRFPELLTTHGTVWLIIGEHHSEKSNISSLARPKMGRDKDRCNHTLGQFIFKFYCSDRNLPDPCLNWWMMNVMTGHILKNITCHSCGYLGCSYQWPFQLPWGHSGQSSYSSSSQYLWRLADRRSSCHWPLLVLSGFPLVPHRIVAGMRRRYLEHAAAMRPVKKSKATIASMLLPFMKVTELQKHN